MWWLTLINPVSWVLVAMLTLLVLPLASNFRNTNSAGWFACGYFVYAINVVCVSLLLSQVMVATIPQRLFVYPAIREVPMCMLVNTGFSVIIYMTFLFAVLISITLNGWANVRKANGWWIIWAVPPIFTLPTILALDVFAATAFHLVSVS